MWIIVPFVAYTVWRTAYYLRKLIPAWHDWRSGASDAYPHEHEYLFRSTLGGLLLIVCLPLPLLMSRASRRGMWVLLAVWAILMAGTIAMDHRASALSPY